MRKKTKKAAGADYPVELSAFEILNCMNLDFQRMMTSQNFKNKFNPETDDMDEFRQLLNAPVRRLGEAHLFVKEIQSSDMTGFVIGPVVNQIGVIKKIMLSGYFDSMCLMLLPPPTDFEPSEEVRLFLDITENPKFRDEKYDSPEHYTCRPPRKIQAEVFNELIEEIRGQAVAPTFKNAVRKRTHAANKNFESARTYVDQLLKQYSKLQVVRLECDVPDVGNSEATMKLAKGCLKKLTNNQRKNQLFASMQGWLWKLEYHPLRGLYFHLMFFYSASSSESSIEIADRIGRYWVARITKNQGKYQSCEGLKAPYISSCIGIVDGKDQGLRDDLHRALYYLTVKDQYLKIGTFGKGRRFGRGEVRCD